MTDTIDVEDRDLQEALQRSLEETNLEEAMVAKALAESISTRDEEIARAMQREQLLMLERSLCRSSQPSTESQLNNRSNPQEENNAPTDEETACSLQTQEAQLMETDLQLPTRHEDEVTSQSEGGSRENVDASASAGPSSQAPRQQTPPSPRSRKMGVGNDTLCDEDLARILQQQEEDEFRERDLQLRMQYEHAFASRSEEDSRENFEASASTAPSSQAFLQQASPRRFFVHQRVETDAKRRRRSEHVVEDEATHPPRTTNDDETSAIPSASSEPVVVVDGQNVGFAYQGGARSRRFCAKGVEVVLDYYEKRGLRAVAMVPAWRGGAEEGAEAELLNKLAEEGRLSFTPFGSHDDNFLLAYAKRKNIDIVSNDRFRKEIDLQETPDAANVLRNFLNEHLIPYTFVNREFLPNPNPRQLSRAEHCSREPRYRRNRRHRR